VAYSLVAAKAAERITGVFNADSKASYGEWTEELVRAAARRRGQPDFVFAPVVSKRGSGTREIGDALLWLGHQLVIVSVKSRHISRLGRDSKSRARSWLDRTVARAVRQIEGTARTLRQGGLTLRSERGVQVPWDPDSVNEVYGVVVINYTPPPDYLPKIESAIPTICVLASEWEFLLETIYSTSGLIAYLAQRSLASVLAPLGFERDVFATLLESERTGQPPELLAGRPRVGKWEEFVGEHADILFGAKPDDRFAFVIDAMIAGAADWDPDWSSSLDPHSYLLVAEVLERIRRLERVALGKRIMEKCRLAYEEGRARYFISALRDGQLFFISHPGDRKERQSILQQFVVAAHTSQVESGTAEGFFTLGVATEPYPNEGRSHDFTFLSGGFRLTQEERATRDNFLKAWFRAPRPVDEEVLRRLDDDRPPPAH
jgi:hypothetical protein